MVRWAALAAWLLVTCELRAQTPAACDTTAGNAPLYISAFDRDSRIPVPGVNVSAAWSAGGARLVTDSLGQTSVCTPRNTRVVLRPVYNKNNLPPVEAYLSSARGARQSLTVDLPSALVRGTIVDQASGLPVAGVAVRMANTPMLATTDRDGRFAFPRVPVRDYTLRTDHVAYAPVTKLLQVSGADLDLSVRLSPSVMAIDPVIVTAFSQRLERSGFYDRKKRGVGMFMTRQQIEAANAQTASDLLRKMPGMRTVPLIARRHAANTPRNMTTSRGDCRYKFIVDGTRTLPDFEMDYLTASSIEGMEVYSGLSEVPADFRGVASSDASASYCGVIVVWMRESR